MFVCSVKFQKKRFVVGTVVVAVIAMIFLLLNLGISQGIDFISGEECLSRCGHSGELISQDEVCIPEEFTPVYEEYNQIQKKQGFDLSDYAGKTCERYTYRLTDTSKETHAVFLVYHGKLIGGDIHEQSYGSSVEPLFENS